METTIFIEPKMPDAHKSRLKSSFTVYKVIPIFVMVITVIGIFIMGFDSYLSLEALRDNRDLIVDWHQNHQLTTVVLFVLTYTLVVALSLPGAIWMTLAGGFIFGTLQATIYVVVSATLGASIVFVLAKFCMADFFKAKTGKALEKLEAGFKSHALSYILFLRLVPIFPFWLVNLAPALLGVPVQTFIIGTAVGIIPGTAIFCWVGSGLGVALDAGDTLDPLETLLRPEIISPIVGFSILSLIPLLHKKFKKSLLKPEVKKL